MISSKAFYEQAINLIDKTADIERNNIIEAAKLIGDCMSEQGVVQLFGLDHGRAFSMELGHRAGGFMPFHQFNTRDLVLRNVITESQLNDSNFNQSLSMARQLVELYRIEKQDMFILISFSGCEAMMVETAMLAKEKGHKIMAVVSKALSEITESTHPSKKKLTDLADLVLDNHAQINDAILDVDDIHKMNQLGTITGNVIAQMLTAEIYRYLTEKELECPILLSSNIQGADDHNRTLAEKYLGRWNS